MKERIVLIPSAAGNEIARSLSFRGINTFALRIIDSFEFAQSALIRSGYVFGKKILTQREQTALIYSIIKKDRDGYFSKAAYVDAENIASAVNMLRFLCPENERENKMIAQKMADSLGVSYSALLNRLKELSLLEVHPLSEYIAGSLHFGGAK